jgi:hypothetical protein
VRGLDPGPDGALHMKAGAPDALLRLGSWLPDAPAYGVFIDSDIESS